MINTLTGRNSGAYKRTGRVLVDGKDSGREMTSISAYVQQEDRFIDALTVQEHLNFQVHAQVLCFKETFGSFGEVMYKGPVSHLHIL